MDTKTGTGAMTLDDSKFKPSWSTLHLFHGTRNERQLIDKTHVLFVFTPNASPVCEQSGAVRMTSVELAKLLAEFQHQSLKLINGFLPIRSSAFFLVGPDMRHRDLVTHNLARREDERYQRRYMHMDPLNPARHENSAETVMHMDSIMSPDEIESSAYFREFLGPMNFRYVADMFFRSEGKIVAVITMLRDADQGAFSAGELATLRHLQTFLEYALGSVYLPKRITERKSITQKYHVTSRELDVLELVLAGVGNKAIAHELTLGLSTVKSHLQHIYRKTGVAGRAELISRIVADLHTRD